VTRCAAALSTHPVASVATGEVAGAVLEALGPEPDLLVLFATRAHTGAIDDIAAAARQLLRPAVLIGTTAVSIAGGAQEIEDEPGLSVLAVRVEGGAGPIVPVRLEAMGTSDGTTILGLPDTSEPGSTLVVLADPFSFPVQELLDALSGSRPALSVVGGLASAAFQAGGNRLLLDGAVHDDGAVGVLLPPGIATRSIVSQGCRPIGSPMVVTGANGNLIESLASEPALPLLLRLVDSLPPADRALAAGGLQLGRVVDERAETYGPGDFLVRSVLGAVRDRNAVAVGDVPPIGTTVQFQVRDASTADHELRALLGDTRAAGALLFTCNGRGTNLFDQPHHDASLVAGAAGPAVAGMFCAGEIGPVGGRPFVHGFTASVLLFDPVADDPGRAGAGHG
jgi:small ligand-binding sensory domain FIST